MLGLLPTLVCRAGLYNILRSVSVPGQNAIVTPGIGPALCPVSHVQETKIRHSEKDDEEEN
eukprot:SAG11_NODE_1237_length_5426_cov_4.878543_3_plen_61_part_00